MALASLRSAIQMQLARDNHQGVLHCQQLLITVMEELRARHVSERRRQHKRVNRLDPNNGSTALLKDRSNSSLNSSTTTDDYHHEKEEEEEEEDNSRNFVEHLIAGSDVTTNPKNEDFIMYTDALTPDQDNVEEILETSGACMLNWSNYAGLNAALEKCYGAISNHECQDHSNMNVSLMDDTDDDDDDDENDENDPSDEQDQQHEQGTADTTKSQQVANESTSEPNYSINADIISNVLQAYLDVWDESIAREAAENEMIELFDATTTVHSNNATTSSDTNSFKHKHYPHPTSVSKDSDLTSLHADIATNFIELATSERARLIDYKRTLLPSQNAACNSAVETVCRKHWMEFAQPGMEMEPFEKSVQDGGKDITSRLLTVPVAPQFPRFVPDYLDHSGSTSNIQKEEAVAPAADDDMDVCSVDEQEENEDQDGGASEQIVDFNTKRRMRQSVVIEEDLNLVKLQAEAEQNRLAIIDITKKTVEDNELQDLDNGSDMSEDGNSLGFPDKHTFDDDSDEGEENHNQNMQGNNKVSEDMTEGTECDSILTHPSTAQTMDSSTTDQQQHKHQQQQHAIHPTNDDIDTKQDASFQMSHHCSTSTFTLPPDGLLGAGESIEMHWDHCLHVRCEGSRRGALLLTNTHIVVEYDGDLNEGELLAIEEAKRRKTESRLHLLRLDESEEKLKEDSNQMDHDEESEIETILGRNEVRAATLRPKIVRWALAEMTHVYLRRYRLRDSAMELFFVPSGGSGNALTSISVFFDFGAGHIGNRKRDEAANAIMKRAPHQCLKQWPERSGSFLREHQSRLTQAWTDGRLSNFDYLMQINILAGRTFNDLCQYPVMPWVLSNYTSETVPNLDDRANYRDLTLPMGALNEERLQDFMERFETFTDPAIPPFMYGSHYSTSAGVVLHFLVRLHPFGELHRQLQGGHFDVADRLFSSIPRTWDMCTGPSAAEVKELTPEWYCHPAFLRNSNQFKLGTSQEGELLGDVQLPPWANGSPEKFIEVMRCALESDICSEMLPHWVDLIFGFKQQGPESIKARNVFFYLTYYGSVDVASIEDEALRTATELQIAHFGQCPMQIFVRPHGHKHLQKHANSISKMIGLYKMTTPFPELSNTISDSESKDKPERKQEIVLPFLNAPLSHWVHLDAPPPGPHASLVAVRLAGIDRCLAVDAHGIFHSFRWMWKPDPPPETPHPPKDEEYIAGDGSYTPIKEVHEDEFSIEDYFDKGCFVAQRELPRFRSIPRLPYNTNISGAPLIVALSKTLFASHSLLLVLSDGDGKGALAMQFVDPAKGMVKSEAVIPSVHSDRITAIAMDPLGTATGGGAGGELAVVGSADGSATLWRFISSHYLPLRPKQRMRGHYGTKIHAVAISNTMNICATVSSTRCCIFNLGNGAMLRSFAPPDIAASNNLPLNTEDLTHAITLFADSPALCLSVQGYIVLVCQSMLTTSLASNQTQGNSTDKGPTFKDKRRNTNTMVITLQLFTLEGEHCGSHLLETWRGVPHKIIPILEGKAVMVCRNRGVTLHRVSPTYPLELIDEWQTAEDENMNAAYDVDIGPSLLRPVMAAAACSGGALRLHALPGISAWSEEHRKGSVSAAVGNALAKPAQKLKNAVGSVKGIGTRVVGFGKELGREAMSDAKERGIGGFFGGVFGRGSGNR